MSTQMASLRSGSTNLQSCQAKVNVGDNERLWSMALGGAMVLLGVSRGRLLGLLATAAGASMLYRGMTGHCQLYQALDVDTTCENC